MTDPKGPAANGPDPILVAVDFSSHSESALLWACRVAKCDQVPVVILHVVHDLESAPSYYHRLWSDKALHRAEELAGQMLEKFVERMRREHPVVGETESLSSELVTGLPPTRILEVAAHIGAQLIVMGSAGRTGLSHLMLGSRAERVVRLSPIPVTIVKRPNLAAGHA